eukprot:gene19064-22829_t
MEELIQSLAEIFETISQPMNKDHWYMTPEYHALEFVGVNAAYFLMFIIGYIIYLRSNRKGDGHIGVNMHSIVPKLVAFVLIINLALNVYYKTQKGPYNLFFMLQPCHIVSAIYTYCLLTNNVKRGSQVFNLAIYYIFVTVSALAFPDTTDLILPGEYHNFYVQHYALIVAPIAIQMYRFPTSFHIEFAMMSMGAMGMLHHTVFEVCSLYSGININYMLSPPPLGFDLEAAIREVFYGHLGAQSFRIIIGPLILFMSWPLGFFVVQISSIMVSLVFGSKRARVITDQLNASAVSKSPVNSHQAKKIMKKVN